MTDHYAVIGNPIAHSKSPQIHAMFAQQTGQDISYEAILAPLDGFAEVVGQLRKTGYKGCNITVPFKFAACHIPTQLTSRAQAAYTVNTIKFDGTSIIGDNTDGAGLIADIEVNLRFLLKGRRVLLLGAGGAAYGIVLPLLEAGATLSVVNRTLAKAQQLGAAFSAKGHLDIYSYPELNGLSFDCIINATSSGLSGEMPPLPPRIFTPGALAYDMTYGQETPFMKFAREQRAAGVADGLGMLVEQAAESFYLWRGVRPGTLPVITAMRSK